MEDNSYKVEITAGRSQINDNIFNWIIPKLKGRVLDIGCNAGYLMEQYKGEIVGVDLSKELIQKAKSKKLEVYHANAYNLPFKANSFDVSVMSCVIEQTEKPYVAINEALRVAKGIVGVSPIPLASEWGFIGGWVRSVIPPEDLERKFKAKIDFFTPTHYGFEIYNR